jgi:WS/DGAT/MGAT family acyltransferase
MLQLSELDSSFLYLETERTPLHVGGVFVFKRNSNDSLLDFNRFKKIIESKLGNEPFFRKRLVEYPLNLDLPVWADDPDLNLNNHVTYEQLNHSSSTDLLNLAAAFFSQALDRTRPLWEARYVDGLPSDTDNDYTDQHFALMLKVHITAISGSSGEDILSQLLHVSPEVSELEDSYPWTAQPLPDTGSWLGAAYNNVFNIPAKLTLLAKDTAASAFYSLLNERLSSLNLPSSLMRVANTPINQKISNSRIIENFEIPLTDIRSIRKGLGKVTTNDVVMGVCAEALSHYLSDISASPQTDLIALAPISVRSTSLDIKSGNQLAATLFSLASSEKDPIKRIRLIHEAATSSNSYDSAISANRLTELVPSCTAGLSARVYTEFLLAQKHKPMFNLPIINIPGPQFPLYFEDSELTKFISTAPLFDGIGLALMIVSYNGNYSLTCTYNPDTLTLKKPFRDYLKEALHTILSSDFSNQELDDEESNQAKEKTGVIEDVVGLVNNLFSLNNK